MAKIFLDPGHGGVDPGAGSFGLWEAHVVLKIMQYAKAALENNYIGVEVRTSRSGNDTVALSGRDDLADNWGADSYTSIHINAGGGEGFETFSYNGTNDSTTNRLQSLLHDNALTAIKAFHPGVKDRGKKKANFSVLRETNMSACLLEILFIDNLAENNLLKTEAFLKAVGEAIAAALAAFHNLKRKAVIEQPKEADKVEQKAVIVNSTADIGAAALLAQHLGCGVFFREDASSRKVAEQIFIAGGSKASLKGSSFVDLSGANRTETAKKVINYIK